MDGMQVHWNVGLFYDYFIFSGFCIAFSGNTFSGYENIGDNNLTGMRTNQHDVGI